MWDLPKLMSGIFISTYFRITFGQSVCGGYVFFVPPFFVKGFLPECLKSQSSRTKEHRLSLSKGATKQKMLWEFLSDYNCRFQRSATAFITFAVYWFLEQEYRNL